MLMVSTCRRNYFTLNKRSVSLFCFFSAKMAKKIISLTKRKKLKKLLQLKVHFIANYKWKNTKPKTKYYRRWWVRPTNRKRHIFGLHNSLLVAMREQDEEEFFRFTRMSIPAFDELLKLTSHSLQKFSQRESIVPEIRLYITLRFLATGDLYHSLHLLFRVGESTVQRIISETCVVLWEVLQPMVLAEPTQDEWEKISLEFDEKWNLPNCYASLDGKHIRIRAPPKSGSMFFNYKKFHSIVLMAMCDANYNFISVDVGAYGSQSDGGVLANSVIGEKLRANEFHFPPAKPLPGTNQLFQPYIVADSGFSLTHNIIRPFLQNRRNNLSDRHIYFNYRLGRGRISIENTFGILVARWGIYQRTIQCRPHTIDKIIKATVVLHNFIKKRNGDCVRYMPPGYVDREDKDGNLIKGVWRKQIATSVLQPVPFDMKVDSVKYKRAAALNREILFNYISPVLPEDVESDTNSDMDLDVASEMEADMSPRNEGRHETDSDN